MLATFSAWSSLCCWKSMAKERLKQVRSCNCILSIVGAQSEALPESSLRFSRLRDTVQYKLETSRSVLPKQLIACFVVPVVVIYLRIWKHIWNSITWVTNWCQYYICADEDNGTPRKRHLFVVRSGRTSAIFSFTAFHLPSSTPQLIHQFVSRRAESW